MFDGGHAGTGISIGEGLALARDVRGTDERIAVVVGDAALMAGLSFEALNDLGQRGTRLLIVLNDNEMSISPTVGAMSRYLSRIKLSRTWRGSRRAYDDAVRRIPRVGPTAYEWSLRLRAAVVDFAQPGRLFEDLGITYVGPGATATTWRAWSRPSGRAFAGHGAAGAASTCGPARVAATGRRRRTRSASTARRCRP